MVVPPCGLEFKRLAPGTCRSKCRPSSQKVDLQSFRPGYAVPNDTPVNTAALNLNQFLGNRSQHFVTCFRNHDHVFDSNAALTW